jgi:hypothetical protein
MGMAQFAQFVHSYNSAATAEASPCRDTPWFRRLGCIPPPTLWNLMPSKWNGNSFTPANYFYSVHFYSALLLEHLGNLNSTPRMLGACVYMRPDSLLPSLKLLLSHLCFSRSITQFSSSHCKSYSRTIVTSSIPSFESQPQ